MMKKASRLRVSVLCVNLALGVFAAGCSDQSESTQAGRAEQPARLVKVGAGSLWRTATRKPLPSYPAESLRNGVGGVAIAEVTVSVSGEAESITVLEAPDARIAEAVRQAVRDWSFVPPRIVGSEQDTRALGKLIFYFVADTGEVKNATASKVREGADAEQGEATARAVNEEQLYRLVIEDGWVALDIRTRVEHGSSPYRYPSVNIPFDEIESRVYAEVSEAAGVAVSCRGAYRYMCVAAANQLLRQGLEPVALSMDGALDEQ